MKRCQYPYLNSVVTTAISHRFRHLNLSIFFVTPGVLMMQCPWIIIGYEMGPIERCFAAHIDLAICRQIQCTESIDRLSWWLKKIAIYYVIYYFGLCCAWLFRCLLFSNRSDIDKKRMTMMNLSNVITACIHACSLQHETDMPRSRLQA